jgi:nicotinamidase-related amidase
MPRKPAAGANGDTALLIIDVISEFEFPGAVAVLRCAPKPLRQIAKLKARAKASGVPIIYVNDMGPSWEWDRSAFVERCLRPTARGHRLVRLIAPDAEDHFIFKPKHSGFYGTPLHALLSRLKIKKLIMTGLTSHQCVLFTAVDAYVREYELLVPRDCIGAPSARESRHAMFIFERALKARLARSTSISLARSRRG